MYRPFNFFDPAFVASLSKLQLEYIQALGGTIEDYEENGKFYRSHTFNSTDTFEVTKLGSSSVNELDVLVVAGGASGGSRSAGGGGAGGYILNDIQASLGEFNITVGAGGASVDGSGVIGNNGNNTSALDLVAIGGGGGGSRGNPNPPGADGGSGGGAMRNDPFITGGSALQPTSTSGGFGNKGGDSFANCGSAGGGGAGLAASNNTNSNVRTDGTNGGDGKSNTLQNGNEIFYAGGGGGGAEISAGSGGSGGGGAGANDNMVEAANGLTNTGGGGGGGNELNRISGAGGSGIVIVRYPILIPDPDALAFLKAAEITDETIITAINNLVIGLKAEDIWDNMIAIYPFVGGTATTHKWNLKDPRDLDAAFRLQFFGGMTHSSTGAAGGLNGYANTYFNPSQQSLPATSTHLAYYSRSEGASSQLVFELGAFDGNRAHLAIRYNNEYRIGLASSQASTFENTNATGFSILSRTSSENLAVYKNGVLVTTQTNESGIQPNHPIFLNAINLNGSPRDFSQKESALASIGLGLDKTEADNFSTLVEAFQTELEREV